MTNPVTVRKLITVIRKAVRNAICVEVGISSAFFLILYIIKVKYDVAVGFESLNGIVNLKIEQHYISIAIFLLVSIGLICLFVILALWRALWESKKYNPPPQPKRLGDFEIRVRRKPAGTGEKIDLKKRKMLKVLGVLGLGVIAPTVFKPNKAEAAFFGSMPGPGVVALKNTAGVKINPATEETLDEVLKKTDLTFDTGSVQVKVTSLPPSSFSDSGSVDKKGLVDADRHVQVDVLSSALPTTASTETTLQTISFGGFKFTLRLATVGDIDYVGEAAIGTATSAASWRIKRVDSASGIIIQWAGTGVFNQIWDNRASLSYS